MHHLQLAELLEFGNNTAVENCRNSGEITSRENHCGGIAGMNATVSNSCNTGKVTGGNNNTTGYIVGYGGTANNTNKYSKQTPDLKSDQAKEFESENEKNSLMNVERFVDKLNRYDAWKEKDEDAFIETWTIKEGLPSLIWQ